MIIRRLKEIGENLNGMTKNKEIIEKRTSQENPRWWRSKRKLN